MAKPKTETAQPGEVLCQVAVRMTKKRRTELKSMAVANDLSLQFVITEALDEYSKKRKSTAQDLTESTVSVIPKFLGDPDFDFIDGLSTAQLSEILTSIANQSLVDTALVHFIAIVLQAFELTNAAFEWEELNKMRPYSLLSIIRVASDDKEIECLLKAVIAAMLDDNGQYSAISHLDTDELHAAMGCLADYILKNELALGLAMKVGAH